MCKVTIFAILFGTWPVVNFFNSNLKPIIRKLTLILFILRIELTIMKEYQILSMIAVIAFTVGCSKYKINNNSMLNPGGYRESAFADNKSFVISYTATGFDSMDTLETFAKFRALERCLTRNALSLFAETNEYRTPIGVPVSYNVINVCEKKPLSLDIKTKLKSAPSLKRIAIEVVEVPSNSINSNVFNKSDLIIEINSYPVTSYGVLQNILHKSKDHTVKILRSEKEITMKLKVKDITPFVEKENFQEIVSSCQVGELKEKPLCKFYENLPIKKTE